MSREKDVLTTGDVARICRVTIRTVIKWFESGALQGYRLPESRDRRFTRDAVERFLRAHDMPVEWLTGVDAPRKRVLVVDDDESIRAVIVRYFDTLGVLDVDTASSGWEAGLKTASQRPDLLLLDYRLGDQTGDLVVRTIRGTQGLPQPAIVLMSAHLTEQEAERVLAEGADAFLAKPFDLELLRETVFRHVGIQA